MKKDIEWLRKRLYQEIGFEALNDKEIGFKIAMEEAIDLLNQLDELEVLSQEWIERNVVHVRGLGDIIEAEVIENLIVPKQEISEEQVMDWLDKNDFYDHITAETVLERAVDKGELSYYGTKYSVIKTPTIPKFVANYLEKAKQEIDLLRVFEIANSLDELDVWRKEYNWIRLYQLDFARAWLDGYNIEEEQKYNVKIKGRSSSGTVGVFLYKQGDEVLVGNNFEAYQPEKDKYMLTEQEIKDFDPRYWVFRQPVNKLAEA